MDPRFLTAEKSPQKTQLHVNYVVLWDCGYPTTLSGESLSICHRPTLRDPGTLQDSIENLGTSYSLTLRDQGTLQDSPEKTRVHVTVVRFGIRVPYKTAQRKLAYMLPLYASGSGYPTRQPRENLSTCYLSTLRDPGTLQDNMENLGTSYSLTLRDPGTLQDSIENMGICYRLTLWNPGTLQDSPEKTRVHVTVLRFGIRVPYNTAEKTWVHVTVLLSRIHVSHKTVQRKLGYMLPSYASGSGYPTIQQRKLGYKLQSYALGSGYPTRQSRENLGTCYRSTLRNPRTLQDSPQKTWVHVTVLRFGIRVPYKTVHRKPGYVLPCYASGSGYPTRHSPQKNRVHVTVFALGI